MSRLYRQQLAAAQCLLWSCGAALLLHSLVFVVLVGDVGPDGSRFAEALGAPDGAHLLAISAETLHVALAAGGLSAWLIIMLVRAALDGHFTHTWSVSTFPSWFIAVTPPARSSSLTALQPGRLRGPPLPR